MENKTKKMNEQAESASKWDVKALYAVNTSLLDQSARIYSAKANLYSREYERLKSKYGTEHPRTVAMEVNAAESNETVMTIAIRHSAAVTPVPEAGKGWAVDGFVRVADGPVQGVTVAPYDKQGRWYSELGHSCTDERGYFSITADKLPGDKEMRVYMHASSGEQMLKSNENRLAPAPGRADRIMIVLDEKNGKGDCAPPPGSSKGETPPVTQTVPGRDKPVKGDSAISPSKDVKDYTKIKAAKDVKNSPEAKPARVARKKGNVENKKISRRGFSRQTQKKTGRS